MILFLSLLLASTSHVYACSGNYIDPDGDNIYFYEECLHMNRGKFTEELSQKCKKYSDIKLQESI